MASSHRRVWLADTDSGFAGFGATAQIDDSELQEDYGISFVARHATKADQDRLGRVLIYVHHEFRLAMNHGEPRYGNSRS
jgi:hypothetical protein